MTDFKFNGDWETVLNLDKLTLLRNDKFFEYSKDTKEKLRQGIVDMTIFDSHDYNPDPSNEQFQAIRFIQENEDLLLHKMFSYVKDVVYPFMKTLIDDEEWWFPKLESVSDLENVLGLTSIQILTLNKDSVSYFTINYNATWDNEHGFHILFHKDRILGHGEAWGFDTKKVCEDCGADYEKIIYDFNHWDETIFDFIAPNPKYGKLTPNQISSNERLPYRLIKKKQEEKLLHYINDGLIDIDYGAHGHSLLATALAEENIPIINFLIQKKAKNFNNVQYVLSRLENNDIKRTAEEYYLKNCG
jgi:hypothetical protein